MSEALPSERVAKTGARLTPARLLCAAAILHLSLSVAIYALGRRALFSGSLDINGVAVAFASDGVRYRADAAALSETLKRGELHDWLIADHPFHVKVYSVCFALFGSLLGFNVLGVEPLNALYYLATLVLVFRLARQLFDRRAGLLATAAVALWPSFLLHTTQFLKDPLFIAAMLALLLVLVRLLTRSYSWAAASRVAAAGALISIALWLTRADMGEMLVANLLLAASMLVARQLRERRAQASNLVAIALLFAATVSVPLVMPNALRLGLSPSAKAWAAQRALRQAATDEAAAATSQESPQTHLWSRAAAYIGKVRRRFIEMYTGSGSNIDSDVQLNGAADLISYLPRAAEVGFFAPFPDMWLTAGRQVGSAGRLLAGLESLAMYAVEGLALVGLWRGRRRLSVWFLSLVATTSMIALGLVVVNVGTLYRLRYVFLMLFIILAAGGVAPILERLKNQRRANREGVVAA